MARRLLCACIIAVSASAAAEEAPAATAVPAHLRAARELLAGMRPELTSYDQRRTVVRWPGEPGGPACHAVCTTAVYAILVRAYGWDGEAIARWLGPERADRHADRVYRRFAAGDRGVVPVAVAAIAPGDLMASDYRSGGELPTGHIAIVDAPPQPASGGGDPPPAGCRALSLAVIDASSQPHDPGDTRWRRAADGAPQPGAGFGRGIMLIAADADGRVAAWARGPGARWHAADRRPIGFFRLAPGFRP